MKNENKGSEKIMKIVFGTTNKRKIADLENIIKTNQLDIEVLTLNDINWNLEEIEETGKTLEENSLIKATAIYNFLKENNLEYPIITDDAGLFVNSLNGEPGIYTARYADEELKLDPSLPKYECVNKLLRNLNGKKDRSAYYKCVVTCMYRDGSYHQESAISYGTIANEKTEPLIKPYFYSVFILNNTNKTFNQLTESELVDTYRYKALKKIIKYINK